MAVFGVPVSTAVLTKPLPDLAPYTESLVCSRFVLLDECPGNAESWFLARCFELLIAKGVRGVVSFADCEFQSRMAPDEGADLRC